MNMMISYQELVRTFPWEEMTCLFAPSLEHPEALPFPLKYHYFFGKFFIFFLSSYFVIKAHIQFLSRIAAIIEFCNF